MFIIVPAQAARLVFTARYLFAVGTGAVGEILPIALSDGGRAFAIVVMKIIQAENSAEMMLRSVWDGISRVAIYIRSVFE